MPNKHRSSNRPSIFISATTTDLADMRQHVLNLVLRSGCYPIVEQGFETLPHNVKLADFLNLQLRACVGVIHLAGLYYGEEVPRSRRTSRRMSWTQMEYDQAARTGKPILVCLADPKRYRRGRYKESGSESEQRAKAKLQSQHYERLRSEGGVYYEFDKPTDIDAQVSNFLGSFKSAPAVDQKVKILFVAAERGTDLELRAQLRKIEDSIGDSRQIKIEALFNPTASEIIAAVNKKQPTIIHLSGRQERGTIMLHNSQGVLAPYDADLLASALAQTNSRSLKLVVLDTCYSMHQAMRLTKLGVPYAVGIYDAIADDVATEFYSIFYSQLASGGNLKAACKTAHDVVVGSLKSNPALRHELEEEVLEMSFNKTVHIPALAVSKAMNPRFETFVE